MGDTQPGNVAVASDLKTLFNARGLIELADKLIAAGYDSMAALPSKDDDVRAAVTKAAGNDWTKPGQINIAVQIWVTWKDAHDAALAKPPAPVDCALAKSLLAAHLSAMAGWLTGKGAYREFGQLGDTDEKVRATVKGVVGASYPPGEIEQVVDLWRAAKNAADTAGDPVSCPLTTALLKVRLREMAVRLSKRGYLQLDALGKDDDAVRATVVSVVGAQYPNPGEIAQVVALCRAARQSTGTVLEVPTLKGADPDGKGIDLTAPTLKIDEVTYKFPDTIVATKDDKTYKTAGELTLTEWAVIAKRTGLMYAVDLSMAASAVDSDSPVLAKSPALVWKPKEDTDLFSPLIEDGSVETELAYTSSVCNLVHSKMSKASLDLQTPFCSASAEMARAEKLAQHTERKVLHVSGRYRYSYAILKLAECVAPHDAFLAAIDTARAQPTPEAQGDALERVFQRFGHLIPETVTLGGELYFTSTRETTGSVVESTVKSNVTVAVKAKYEGFALGGGGGTASGDKNAVEVQQISEHAKSCCSGGDGYLASSPKEWPATTRNPNRWAVISRTGARPLTSLLDENRRTWVESLWNARLKTYWGGVAPPPGYIKPDLDGVSFILRSGMDDARALGLLASLDPRNQPVGLVTSSALLAPIGDRLSWQFRYSGSNAPSGAPIYFIVESLTEAQKTARAASWRNKLKKFQDSGFSIDPKDIEPIHCARLTARLMDGTWKVICEQVPDAGSDQPIRSNPAAWTVTPIDLEHKPDAANGVGYVITSYAQPNLGFGAPAGIGPRWVPLVAAADQKPWYCHVPK